MSYLDRIERKILTGSQAAEMVSKWQQDGLNVVFSNGCFDLVHRGHIEYLSKAADLGDKFVIGLNTDQSVARIKGSKRPLVDEKSRAILLAALTFVDAVVFFDEDTPYELIKLIKPNYLVKGADYKPESIVGYDIVTANGGAVKTIDFVEGFSSTALIQKIKEAY